MILYLDASALVKRYIAEAWTNDVEMVVGQAQLLGSGAISQVEVTSALARAARTKGLNQYTAQMALRAFHVQWADFIRLPVTDALLTRASDFAWQYGLRGYDAMHLAAACAWSDAIGSAVTLATFDRGLRQATPRVGLLAWPGDLPALLSAL